MKQVSNWTLAVLLMISICLSLAGIIAITSNPVLTGLHSTEVCPCLDNTAEPVLITDKLEKQNDENMFKNV